jgi:hypothetical protein
MKQIFFFIALFVGVTTASFAQTTPAAPSTQKASGPVMKLETEVVDYGVIAHNSEPVRVFKFTNTGTEPLIISNARGSCGCTVPTYPTAPIMPGEKGEIKVRYDTAREGKFTKFVTLTTNETQPERRLTIQGEVKPKPTQESLPAKTNLFNNGTGK